MRYENPDLTQGLWVRPLKKADWKQAIEICADSLKTKTKDLQIAAWLIQALLRQYGFPGLKYGLNLILLLSRTFWDNIYPKDENNDLDVRLSPYVWIEQKLSIQLKFIPITVAQTDYEPYTYEKWEKVNLSVRQTKNENINPITGYLQFVGTSAEDFHLVIESNIKESLDIIGELKKFLHEKTGDRQPHFVHFEAALSDILSLNSAAINEINKNKVVVEEKIIIDKEEVKTGEIQKTKAEEVPNEISISTIRSIDHAYKILGYVSEYLLKHEPNYPTGYIVKNALSYRYLILKEFLREQIKSASDLQKVYEILRIK
jgi:type VI secretion system protein ImpA